MKIPCRHALSGRLKTWQGELPRGDQCYLFVLEDSERQQAVGVCAIEVAVGLTEPWYQLPRRHAGACVQTVERV
jgi:arginine/ornithine N-succinyltransferase beta subunit